jgi:group II intron reverse transcriptase/maturase
VAKPSGKAKLETHTDNLLESIVQRDNMNKAMKRIIKNKGSHEIDGIKIEELKPYLMEHGKALVQQILAGKYEPQPVRKVDIPKPDGGTRGLGIPVLVDRVIQQAIAQVLSEIYEPTFSESSYGFRLGRSAHMALKQAQIYMNDGYKYVVDMDLEKFFDRVNHDILMSLIARKVSDGRVMGLIRKYLNAGLMKDGVTVKNEDGVPQGGPLSPLLSNIMLDVFDKELEKRGHKFCRYADDCNIYV